MTQATQGPNGATPHGMTTPKATDHGSEADTSNAPKTSPSQKGTSSSGAEGTTRSPKKRRKVNHGQNIALCILAHGSERANFWRIR